jgi:hypothetical protein
VSVTPPGAIYSTSTTTATNAESVASTTITGTGIYTGTFTSPNLTIIAATITGTAASPSTTYNAGSQSGTVITGVLPVHNGEKFIDTSLPLILKNLNSDDQLLIINNGLLLYKKITYNFI